MRNFHEYMADRSFYDQKRRIAVLMAERRVDPYSHIQEYLNNAEGLLTEGWLGGFFKRLGNAWRGFWKNPNPEDSPLTRLEAAQKALTELQQMMQQNQGADQGLVPIILKGLEQSLAIVGRIEPSVQQLSQSIQQYAQTGVPHSDPHDGLPPDLDKKWTEIMKQRDTLIAQPDSEEKVQRLMANDDAWLQFRTELEQINQGLNPHDSDPSKVDYKKRVENWLKRIDTDGTFRQIENLLDLARKRKVGGMLAKRPQGVEQVLMAYRQIAAATTDQGQRKQQMVQWYAKLPDTHPVKAFIRQELKDSPELGTNENELFYRYAHDWMTQFPHHMGN